MEEVLGVKANIKRLPVQQGDVPRTYADIAKAETLLGYYPKSDLITGLCRFIDCLKKDYPKIR